MLPSLLIDGERLLGVRTSAETVSEAFSENQGETTTNKPLPEGAPV